MDSEDSFLVNIGPVTTEHVAALERMANEGLKTMRYRVQLDRLNGESVVWLKRVDLPD